MVLLGWLGEQRSSPGREMGAQASSVQELKGVCAVFQEVNLLENLSCSISALRLTCEELRVKDPAADRAFCPSLLS